ncbi:hypothetical protein [Paracoccus sp. 22332]|uniref:hypothetical protein n=1 Tax=Paracoccus sp. 22332 TaxID=3453913 RepID=UPI003F86BF55
MDVREIRQVDCIKWSTKFGPQYVNRLHGMIGRDITPPVRLLGLTDDGAGLHPDMAVRPVPVFAGTLDLSRASEERCHKNENRRRAPRYLRRAFSGRRCESLSRHLRHDLLSATQVRGLSRE